MDRTSLTPVHLTRRLRDAVLADRNAQAVDGAALAAMTHLALHRVPFLGPKGAHECNWTWSCPGAAAELLPVIQRHADALQRRYDLA
jgi:hypothetical protein